ncbi:unnamed protein product [Polarella glacialis]|uniref:VTT domain-containing protein n=1 Tax=Polarella glacialis TaxID=89957 RepID=A0A813L1P1_POLGL|nr:unnamed protein product [Polarella glacialis]
MRRAIRPARRPFLEPRACAVTVLLLTVAWKAGAFAPLRPGALIRQLPIRSRAGPRSPPRTRAVTSALPPLPSAESVADLAAWAQASGPVGVAAFAAAHAASIALCLPITVIFEVAAGFVWGLPGAALVWATKLFAASITFFIGRVGATVLAPSLVERIKAEVAARGRGLLEEQKGLQLAVAARLSPLPSFFSNYGLAVATDLKFADFFLATAVATVPSILGNVYSGTTLLSLVEAHGELPNAFSLGAQALQGLGVLSLAWVGQQLLVGAAASPALEEEKKEDS